MSAEAGRRRRAAKADPFAKLNGRRVLAPRIVPPPAHPGGVACLGDHCTSEYGCFCPPRCVCRCGRCECTVAVTDTAPGSLDRP